MYKKIILTVFAAVLFLAGCGNNSDIKLTQDWNKFGITIDSDGIDVGEDNYYLEGGDVVATINGVDVYSQLVDDIVERVITKANEEVAERYAVKDGMTDEEIQKVEEDLTLAKENIENYKGQLRGGLIQHISQIMMFRTKAEEAGLDISPERKSGFLNYIFNYKFNNGKEFERQMEANNGNIADFVLREEITFYQFVLILDDFFSDYECTSKDLKEAYEKYPEDRKVKKATVALSLIMVQKETPDEMLENTEEAEEEATDKPVVGKAKISEALKELEDGVDFSEVVQKYSEDYQSLHNGGAYGAVTKDYTALPSKIIDKAFKMKADSLSGIVETDTAYYILKTGAQTAEKVFTADDLVYSLKLDVFVDKAVKAEGSNADAVYQKINEYFDNIINSAEVQLADEIADANDTDADSKEVKEEEGER
jgi:hypothetical protein